MIDHKNKSRVGQNEAESGGDTSLVLSLSLFIILLAFFIVLNGLSEFSKPKVDQAFDSLDLAFATNILPADLDKASADERASADSGSGDAVEQLQGILTSLLPDLNMNIGDGDTSSGNIMMIRLPKDRFERLADDLVPLFVRILTQKDQKYEYGLVMDSYVRDTGDDRAFKSFSVLNQYKGMMVRGGLEDYRVSLGVERGNPAMMSISFLPMEAMHE